MTIFRPALSDLVLKLRGAHRRAGVSRRTRKFRVESVGMQPHRRGTMSRG